VGVRAGHAQQLTITNLYEDAYYGLAQYEYARQWGTEQQQLAGIRRAIAGEDDANYLPKAAFRTTLEVLLQLQVKTNDFGGALDTWSKLSEHADAEMRARWEDPIRRIVALRADPRPYTVSGEFSRAPWWEFQLFTSRFQIEVDSGRVSEIKLRCDKKYVFFKYEPGVQYTVSEKYGACGMELVGDPGTKFRLIQS
jgi:hypothetical protein